jgi:phage FluMu gp28-like protein
MAKKVTSSKKKSSAAGRGGLVGTRVGASGGDAPPAAGDAPAAFNIKPGSTQAKDKNQREAIDELHAGLDAEGCGKKARAHFSFEELQAMDAEQLEKLVADHPMGASVTGWKSPYPLADPRHLLLEYQDRVAHDRSRFKDTLQARQTGKDFASQCEVGETLFGTANSRYLIAAPSERQSLDSLGQGKLWCRAFGLYIDDYQEKREGDHPEALLKSAEIVLSNGSKAEAVPGRPETVRGKSANVLVTEADFLENPTETIRALLPSILNPLRGGEKKLRYISTPNGVGNVMHKTRTQPKGKMRWSHHTVNILQAILMGLPVDYEVMMEAFGDDREGARQELLCEFLDGSNVLLPYDLIQMSESLEATEVWDPALALRTSMHANFIGIDFGRQNDPTVLWDLQMRGGCLWTVEVLVLEKMDTPSQVEIVHERVAASTRTCFDYTGPGIGMGDYLVQKHGEYDPEKHKFGKVELCTFTSAFKRELFPALRRCFEASSPTAAVGMERKAIPLRIPVSRAIREDLHAVQQELKGAEYNYWSPRTRKGHSDRCTALALAVRAAGAGGGPFAASRVTTSRRDRARQGGKGRWGRRAA